MYLNAFLGRGRPYLGAMHLPRNRCVNSLLFPRIVVPSNAIFSPGTDSWKPSTSVPFHHYSIQITALRAVKCKANIYGSYEECLPEILGSASGRWVDFGSLRAIRPRGIHYI